MCMVKTDSAGTVQWSRIWAPADTLLGLGTNSMELMNQNKYIFSMLVAQSGMTNSWLVSFDSTGHVKNNIRFNDSGSQGTYRVIKVKGNEIGFIKKIGSHFINFIKLDTSLTPLNMQLYNDSSSYNDIADMAVTLGNEFIFTGNEYIGNVYHTLIIKTDTSALIGCYETPDPIANSTLAIIDSSWTVSDSR